MAQLRFRGYACDCMWCVCDYYEKSHPVWRVRGYAGTEATWFMSKRSMEQLYHCQGTESTAETLEMLFINYYSPFRQWLLHLSFLVPEVMRTACDSGC